MTHDEHLPDSFAGKRSFLSRIDARVKLSFVVLGLVINLVSPGAMTSPIITAFCLALLLGAGVPPKMLLLRLTVPLVMVTVVLVTQLFLYGGTPLFTLPWPPVTAYQEGLARGLLIVGRVLGGTSLVLFLGMSTPPERLFLAARWFRVSETFIELALLTYRYIFVLFDEVTLMRNAQKVRLGYHSWRQSMRSLGMLGAGLVIRAYDRASRVFESMLVRGYGHGVAPPGLSLSPRDGLAALGLAIALGGFYLVGRLW